MGAHATHGERRERALRIGDVARLLGITPRTIRYYEEIGLLSADPERLAGGHRTYGRQEVERLQEIINLRHLLGLSLEELREVLSAEEAREALREEYKRADLTAARRIELLREALKHVDRQLELVERRRRELDRLVAALSERKTAITRKLGALAANRERGSRGDG